MSGMKEFFSGGDLLNISAVDAAGDASPVGPRYSKVLQCAAILGNQLVAGAAMGAALLATTPAEASKAMGGNDIPAPGR